MKSRDYRDVIVFENFRFRNVFRPHENVKTAFFEFLRRSVEGALVPMTCNVKPIQCLFNFLTEDENRRLTI